MHHLLVMIFAASAPPAAAAPCSAATTALLPPPARRRWLLFGVALNLLFSVGCGPALLTSYANTALAGQPQLSAVVPSVGFSREGGELFSAEWLATLVAPATAAYSFQCEVANGAAILWLDDHLLCGTPELFAPEDAPLPPFMQLTRGNKHFLRIHFYHNQTSTSNASLAVLWQRVSDSGPITGSLQPVPPGVLLAAVPPEQTARLAMQANLSTGWGTWWRPSALAATLLPEGATLTLGLCQLSTGLCIDPTQKFTPEQGRGPEEPCDGVHCNATAWPGVHAWDRSYWQLYVGWQGLNVSLEWCGTNAGRGVGPAQDLGMVATVITGNATDFSLRVLGDFKYHRAGTVTVSQPRSSAESGMGGVLAEIRLAAHGMRDVTMRALTPPLSLAADEAASNVTLQLNLSNRVAALTSASAVADLAALQAAMAVARTKAAFRLTKHRLGKEDAAHSEADADLVEGGGAMQAGLMWNVLWHPTQAGPFISVSRSFTAYPYEIFEWDTYFGALMLSYDGAAGLALAISSIVQVTKGKTLGPNLDGHGFVPGYSKGGRWLSEDRTERPVGASILLRIFRRWGQPAAPLSGSETGGSSAKSDSPFPRWLLKLLYPDLLDWHHWLWDQRRLQPLGLGCAGSDLCVIPPIRTHHSGRQVDTEAVEQASTPPLHMADQTPKLWCKKSWGMGSLQGARFESLDNSPMYDPPGGQYQFWNSTTHRMQLYDVGQSAAIVAESTALADIAELLDQREDASMLRQRAASLGALINRHQWLPSKSVYANLLINGTSYPRISPTSFLPLLAHVASNSQAEATISLWLTNRSRFCVPASAELWPPPGGVPSAAVANTTCYYGMPSISADDSQFLVAGGTSGIYWRGETWAPQAFLTYLGLDQYASQVPAAAAAKAGLAKQQLALLLSVWRAQHHICENYAPNYRPWLESPNAVAPSFPPGARAGNECTGNHFYTWGGLSAFMALMEAGHY